MTGMRSRSHRSAGLRERLTRIPSALCVIRWAGTVTNGHPSTSSHEVPQQSRGEMAHQRVRAAVPDRREASVLCDGRSVVR